MNIHESVAQWMAAADASDPRTRGLVPTMGALHEGHGALIAQCVEESRQSVVTIYVNPTQFENPDDLSNYPDSLQDDIRYLESLGVTDLVLPQYKELYPFDFTIFVDESQDSMVLCGKNRTGHFKGVLSVVMKLINLTQARRVYFGKKDFQQYRLVSKMVEAYFMPTIIIGHETVRDEYGLALSSRNRRLSPSELTVARQLNVLLQDRALSSSEVSIQLDKLGFRVDYCEERWGRRFVAAHLGAVRLIDNVAMAESTL
ncbi:4-phosphopantoate--beta-alanine ligase [Granulosicoccus antarcticus]|uniref:Pantothenate synthetase n=1 Tax=Granulosicoccus antarcticus IMCC3135 TaxID=1192854 RepID=A0A2Z2NVT2_9GAMM|nr:pantoate--beta-alanine ligase [Granulosicoccus antarcticus]ASJ71264.1 Pantothenate synthetase [Granulosicoccus antarcticus IMCC3135]